MCVDDLHKERLARPREHAVRKVFGALFRIRVVCCRRAAVYQLNNVNLIADAGVPLHFHSTLKVLASLLLANAFCNVYRLVSGL